MALSVGCEMPHCSAALAKFFASKATLGRATLAVDGYDIFQLL